MDEKTKKDLLEFLKYEKSRRQIQLGFAETVYERHLIAKGETDPEIEVDVERMTNLRNSVTKFKYFIRVLERSLIKEGGVGTFDLRIPIFPKSDDDAMRNIVNDARTIINMYGCISIQDVYDIIEDYYPPLKTILYEDYNYLNVKYGWKYANDLYVLYTNGGVTIGRQCEPISLVD